MLCKALLAAAAFFVASAPLLPKDADALIAAADVSNVLKSIDVSAADRSASR